MDKFVHQENTSVHCVVKTEAARSKEPTYLMDTSTHHKTTMPLSAVQRHFHQQPHAYRPPSIVPKPIFNVESNGAVKRLRYLACDDVFGH